MRKALTLGICLLLLCVAALADQRGEGAPGEAQLGVWSGTWAAEGTPGGGFELTLQKGTEGSLGGQVSVTGAETYKATLATVTFEGPKMTAKYDFPPDENIVVALEGKFEGNSVAGTWAAREKSSGNELASGAWTATRK